MSEDLHAVERAIRVAMADHDGPVVAGPECAVAALEDPSRTQSQIGEELPVELQVVALIKDGVLKDDILITLHRALDINLSIMTSSYQEEKLKKVFVSHKAEQYLVKFAERMLHGFNLFLTIGLLIMANRGKGFRSG